MASIQNIIIRSFLRLTANKKNRIDHSVERVRKSLEKLTDMSKMPKGVKFEKVNCNGVEAEWAIPDNLQNKGAVIFLHGGAYIAGSIDTHRPLVGRLAIASKTKFISVEYGLAPEKPFPHGLEDAVKVYYWLMDKGFDHKKIVFCGDSAGGGLSICALMKLRDDNAPQPAGAAVMSPWLDLLCDSDSAKRLAKSDVMLTRDSGKKFAEMYAKDYLKHPHVSPLHNDPSGLPPIYIQVSTAEILLDDSVEFGKKAKEVGVDIVVEPWDKMVHVWQAFAPYLPEGNEAIKGLGAFIEKKTK